MWPQALCKGNTQKEASRLSFSCLVFTLSVQAKQVDLQRNGRTDRIFAKASPWPGGPNLTFTRANASWFQSDSLPMAASLEASGCLRTEWATKLIFKYPVLFKKKCKNSSCDSTSTLETMRWASGTSLSSLVTSDGLDYTRWQFITQRTSKYFVKIGNTSVPQ